MVAGWTAGSLADCGPDAAAGSQKSSVNHVHTSHQSRQGGGPLSKTVFWDATYTQSHASVSSAMSYWSEQVTGCSLTQEEIPQERDCCRWGSWGPSYELQCSLLKTQCLKEGGFYVIRIISQIFKKTKERFLGIKTELPAPAPGAPQAPWPVGGTCWKV